ncbi:TIR-like protein FxsC [Streptomyces europaeiscabiei]|uniref:TIR-like protein FxsC n=1 Tax=Streptomyces europaeiscabiei TaxID=146819 RepID=UPI0029A98A00|nr:TIR-like protein FxsC [Streptomyces europaeiscabiei]MDX3583268.1 TIR-like protein FxsC [Streptomyces europaeiscabiei]MDX3617859.1 TIR-like protein FxsC [Streptomyces europaeiscabiei]WUD35219.1 TIR-like protein FxsC [Streptomyces europaeiscabiei]
MEREPYFFLSYARRDDRGSAFVRRFYDDLLAELGRLGADCSGQQPFLDIERLGLGMDWESALGNEIGHCRALVTLCSPAYVNSLYCGKEWAAFESRLVRYREQTDIEVPALIPVLWVPLHHAMPPEISKYQYFEPPMGQEYLEQGLMGLLRSAPGGRAYRTVLELVAKRVQHVADLFRLPRAQGLDLGAVRSPFEGREPAGPGRHNTGHVRVFIAAGVTDPLPTGRQRCEYYGPSPLDWTPYHPPIHPTVAYRAQRVIIDEGCTSSLEVVDRGLGEKLDEATNNNQTSVLLVDAWAARESRYRAPLSDYDRQNHPVTGVLVPCHETDEESVDEKLWTDLQQIFRRNWMRRNDPYDPLFQVQVERQRFEDRLARMVVVAQNRLMEKAVPRRLPAGPSAPPMPGLSVPYTPPSSTDDPVESPGRTPLQKDQDDER